MSSHIQVPLNFVALMIGVCDNGYQHDNFSLRETKITMKSVTLIFAHFSYILGQSISIEDKHFILKRSSCKLSIVLIMN